MPRLISALTGRAKLFGMALKWVTRKGMSAVTARLIPAFTPAWKAVASRADFEARCRRSAQSIALDDDKMIAVVLGNQRMLLSSRDLDISVHLALDGYWESPIATCIAQRVQPGWVCVDVGANSGFYTLLLGNVVGKTGSVLACEPNPRLVPLMSRSLRLNGLRWVEVFSGAVSNQGGQATFTIPSDSYLNATMMYHGAGEKFTAETRTLDRLMGGRKVDF